jgi:RNA polymerase sigma-70 factor (ECF subfamily)
LNRDADYIKRTRAGDLHAYAALVDKYQSMVFVLVRSVCRNAEDAREVTQDVFLQAYRQLHTFRGAASFKTWLYRIAYNTAISHIRKEQSRERRAQDYREHVLQASAQTTVQTPAYAEEEQDSDEQQRYEKLRSLVASLPPKERLLIELYYYKDLKIDEIAHICSLTPSNVKVSMFRIRQKLKAGMRTEIEREADLETEVTTISTNDKL